MEDCRQSICESQFAMEMILFIGIQATGKSSFYKDRLYQTHVRLNYDMLRTRRREQLLFDACLEGKTSFVVDNTNLTREERAIYILPARAAGFEVNGYFFQSKVADALKRNAARIGKERIPDKGVLGASARLEVPGAEEGFTRLHYVRMLEPSGFLVEEWKT